MDYQTESPSIGISMGKAAYAPGQLANTPSRPTQINKEIEILSEYISQLENEISILTKQLSPILNLQEGAESVNKEAETPFSPIPLVKEIQTKTRRINKLITLVREIRNRL